MSARYVLQRILSVLVPLSILATAYLYLYPVVHGCSFPQTGSDPSTASTRSSAAFLNTVRAHIGLESDSSHTQASSFRLLVLADPQIEGDSSLPSSDNGLAQRFKRRWKAARSVNLDLDGPADLVKIVRKIVVTDIPQEFRAARKRLDLYGNDFYLAHIYRTLHWWTKPTHVTVLGDLIGSQWVSDGEFQSRSWRYWERVFRAGVRVNDNTTITGSNAYDKEQRQRYLQLNDSNWSNRIINIAGNHDVGYAGDITEDRMGRFQREFGRPNWDVRFEDVASDGSADASGTNPTLHLVVLNSLSLDGPALTPSFQSETLTFLNDMLAHRSPPVEDRTSFTLLLTHLPLHKEEGVCTDSPYIAFHTDDDEDSDTEVPRFKAGGLREQNHLSEYLSHNGILQGIFGMSGDRSAPAAGKGRNGLILTGHDHAGCDVVHFVDRQEVKGEGQSDDASGWSWNARRYAPSSSSSIPNASRSESPSVREVTVRSMMGEYGGNAGLLSVWFDSDPSVQEWKYEITMCPLGVQHIWWAIHVLGITTIILISVWVLLYLSESRDPGREEPTPPSRSKKNQKSSRVGSSKGKSRDSAKSSPKQRGKNFNDHGRN